MTTIPADLKSPEGLTWLAGAKAEREARIEGFTDDAKQFLECVDVLGSQGEDAAEMARWLAIVFTCEQPFRWRFKLAWRILNIGDWKQSLKVYIDTNDVWVGYYRGDTHHYVCPLPTVVIRWRRR